MFHYVKYHDQGLIRKVNNITRQLQEKNDSNPQTLFVPLGLELLQDVKEVIVNTRRRGERLLNTIQVGKGIFHHFQPCHWIL